jgi:mono/diheme cytochrome c family protein
VPALVAMARDNNNPLARLHALWTLEGLDAVPSNLVMEKLKDADGRVRCAAVRISEPSLERHDATVLSAVTAMAASDPDPHVASQVGLSLIYSGADATVAAAMASREKAGLKSETPKALVAAYEAERLKKSQVASRQAALARRNPRLAAMVAQGRALYAQTCIACHGPDGRGTPSPAGTGTLAPPLAGSKRLMGNPELVCRIVLRGLVGPNDGGVIYPNEMAGFPWADDQWISSILTYARQEWGNTAGQISVARVAKVRRETADRAKPFTLAELAELKLPGANAPATAPSPAAKAQSSK